VVGMVYFSIHADGETRRRADGETRKRPISRYGAVKAEPGRIPAVRGPEPKGNRRHPGGRKPGRGSFGIVERVSMASESHDPQTLLGDEESEPEVRSSRKAEAKPKARSRRLRPPANSRPELGPRPDSNWDGNPERVEVSAKAPSGFLASGRFSVCKSGCRTPGSAHAWSSVAET